MDQLQSKLYELLVEVDDICKRNDVVYYIAGGTALGAIRGGGFLPWDDDIDLYITRKNWDKLVKVMETETPENRIFVCNENTENYCNPVGRYVDKETTVMMKSQLLCGKACGLLIEFFIMDPMPLSEEGKWRHRQLVKVYGELLSPYFVTGKNIITDNKDYDCNLYEKYYKRSLKEGKDTVIKEILDEITSVDEEDSDCYCMRWGIRTLMYGKDLLGTPRLEKFENAKFPVPAKQEEVARIAYGDSWMYVPEGAAKVVHGLNKDLTTPFKTYVDLYMPFIDKDELLENHEANKRVRASALYKKHKFKREFAIARGKIAAKNINENNISELRQLLEEKKFDELTEHLSYYYSQQCGGEIKEYRYLMPLSDEYIYIAIMNRILTGAYYKANSIMAFRKETGKELTDDLKYADHLMDVCRALSVAVFDKRDTELVYKLLEEYKEVEDILVDYARAKIWYLCHMAKKEDDYNCVIAYAKEAYKTFGEDGEIVRFEGYALYKLNMLEESEARYRVAIKKTRNGFVWREAGDLFGIDAYDIVDNQVEEDDSEEEELDED